jgi:hypothetical protein
MTTSSTDGDPQDVPGEDPEVLDDLAAEPDDTEPADDPGDDAAGGDAGDGDGDDADDEATYAGTARGGPYDGLRLVSRFPSGILLVDRPDGWALVYDYDDGEFHARENADLDDDGRWQAAEGCTYDVRAFEQNFTGDDEPAL